MTHPGGCCTLVVDEEISLLSSLSYASYITLIHLAGAFIQSYLQLRKYKRFIIQRQINTGSARDTKFQALFGLEQAEPVIYASISVLNLM